MVEAELGRPGPPAGDQLADRQLAALGLPRRQCGGFGGARARRPALRHRRLDLRAAAAEGPQHRLRDADELGDPVADRQPLHPERAGQLGAQHGLVDEARRPRMRVQPAAIQRRPPAVRSAAQVGDQDVSVQLRIARPRRAMPKRRRHQPRRRHDLSPAMAATDRRRRTLEIADGLEDRAVVRAADRGTHLAAADPEQDADALRRRERQIKPGDPDRARRAPQRRAVLRVKAREHPPERFAVDRPGEAERQAA